MSAKKIGKVQSKRSKEVRSKGKSKLTPFKIILIASFFTLIVGITFAIVQFVGEYFGVFPLLSVGELSWGFGIGDSIIIFVVALLSSVFIGSIIVLFIIKNQLI